MKFKTVNPATGQAIKEFETMRKEEVFSIASKVNIAFSLWSSKTIAERAVCLKKYASHLREKKEDYAGIITKEMGKPIKEAIAEIEKCAWCAEVYAENGENWLKDELLQADGKKHIISFEPLGTILSIMPWNFPFWQAIRFGVPALLAGNVCILKHASNVTECALAIEKSFMESGFPENVFRTIIAEHDIVSGLLESDCIQAASLTGSTTAGMKVGSTAGKSLKPFVLELGGSDPFIVLEDADPDFAARNACIGRALNAGQSCIAAKRFIVMKSIANDFTRKFAENMRSLKQGNPDNPDTKIGPMVNEKQLNELDEQVKDAVKKGAKVETGGKRADMKGYFYLPTVLSNVNQDMKVAKEEVFGPVAPVITVSSIKKAMKIAKQLKVGSVFINSIVKSDPRLPFGGIKKSGIGRELSSYGLKEFVNIKTINLYEHAK